MIENYYLTTFGGLEDLNDVVNGYIPLQVVFAIGLQLQEVNTGLLISLIKLRYCDSPVVTVRAVLTHRQGRHLPFAPDFKGP